MRAPTSEPSSGYWAKARAFIGRASMKILVLAVSCEGHERKRRLAKKIFAQSIGGPIKDPHGTGVAAVATIQLRITSRDVRGLQQSSATNV